VLADIPLGRRASVALAVAISLLLGAWLMSNAPFEGPDEASHYLRALTIANGQLIGPRVHVHPVPFLTTQQLDWTASDSRGVVVPARMSPPNENCFDGRADLVGSCTELSYTADYQPLPYLLPALALKASDNVQTTAWTTRVASALLNLAFILLALLLASRGGKWSVAGLLVALTPMVFFVSSVLNPNGLEIDASMAFVAGLLWLARDPPGMPPWALAATGLSGVAVVLAWTVGPVFAAIDLGLTSLLWRRDQLALLGPRQRRTALASGLALLGALAIYLIYASAAGLAHAGVNLQRLGPALRTGLAELTTLFHDGVGVFGALSVRLPAPVYWLWWALVLGLCVAALVLSSRRGRSAMGVTMLTLAVFPVLFYALVYRQSGWGLQGRYILPILIVAPMMAGDLIGARAQRASLASGAALIAVVTAAGLLQLIAWWVNARVTAGGSGSIWFLGHPGWTPPLGWWPWTAAALGATAAVVAVAALQLRALAPQRVAPARPRRMKEAR
jgi:hypothetical protein